MSIHYASDLHLESGDGYQVNTAGETLVLAGDVCPIEQIESWLPTLLSFSKAYQNVIWVFGNHEWWSKTPQDQLLETTRLICDAFCPNVTLVPYRERLELPNTTLLCATLWSYPGARAATQLYGYAKSNLTEIHGLTIKSWREQHLADVRWLRSELEKPCDKPLLVVTHFAPMLRNVCAPKYRDPTGVGQQGYGTDVLQTLNKVPSSNLRVPDAWVFGHTHYDMCEVWYGTMLQSNPRGNGRERADPAWPWKGPRKVSFMSQED